LKVGCSLQAKGRGFVVWVFVMEGSSKLPRLLYD